MQLLDCTNLFVIFFKLIFRLLKFCRKDGVWEEVGFSAYSVKLFSLVYCNQFGIRTVAKHDAQL